MVWAEMSDQALPKELPAVWIERWRPKWLAMQEQRNCAKGDGQGILSRRIFLKAFMDRGKIFPHSHGAGILARRTDLLWPWYATACASSCATMPYPRDNTRRQTELFDLLHLRGTTTPSRSEILSTKKARFLRDFCPPSFVERLKADDGLRAFARFPERSTGSCLDFPKPGLCSYAGIYAYG